MLHPLFSRQLTRLGIDVATPPSPEAWARLLGRISLAYAEADDARYLLERSLEMSSREMQELYERNRASSEYLIGLERDKLAAVLRSVAAGVLTLDHMDRVASLNPEGERLLGFGEGEARGREVCALLAVERLERGSAASQVDAEFACKSGPPLPVSYALTPLYQGGVEVGGVLVFFDLTERQKVDRLKSDFVSTVSHELRTPLTALRGALGLLSGGVLGELSPEASSMVEIAQQSAMRLIGLVNDILDMQKIESGKMDFSFTVCDLTDLVRRSVADNQPYARELGVDLAIVGAPVRALVRVDRNRMLQVLANLISNAAKFSPQGGLITLHIAPRLASFCIEVHDDGDGIPEAFRARIFHRFAQADASPSRAHGGTGLGLSISKSIVEHHGGRISFVSDVASGTTFCVEIPGI